MTNPAAAAGRPVRQFNSRELLEDTGKEPFPVC